MLIEAATLVPGTTLRADVCVIGGGPAGLTTTYRLAEGGVDVVLLESGSSVPPPGGEPYEGARNVGLPYPLETSRSRGLGGTSHRWEELTPYKRPYVRLRELDALDFESRPGLAFDGWPFAKEALEPHYRAAWELFGLRLPDPADDEIVEAPVETRMFDFGPAAAFTEWLPHTLRRHPNVRVVAGATATDLRTDDGDERITSVLVRTEAGAAFSAVARIYVLAAGGIENARLLLASSSTRPAGLGNRHDLVGRYFMEHPHYASGLLFPADGALLADVSFWDVVVEDGRARQRKYGIAEEVVRGEALLNIVFRLLPRPPTRPVVLRRDGAVGGTATQALLDVRAAVGAHRLPPAAAVARVARASPALGRYVLQQAAARRAGATGTPSRVQQVFTLSTMAEQEPLSTSRVRLGSERDRFGVPIAELDWRTGALDTRSMRRAQALVGPALARRLGARVASLVDALDEPHTGWGFHHMGTTRMSSDPERGVVDADCRVHGVPNLFAIGSSVFPTGGYANPTLTIVALAFRLGAHLAEQTGEQAAAVGENAAPP